MNEELKSQKWKSTAIRSFCTNEFLAGRVWITEWYFSDNEKINDHGKGADAISKRHAATFEKQQW